MLFSELDFSSFPFFKNLNVLAAFIAPTFWGFTIDCFLVLGLTIAATCTLVPMQVACRVLTDTA